MIIGRNLRFSTVFPKVEEERIPVGDAHKNLITCQDLQLCGQWVTQKQRSSDTVSPQKVG